MGAVAEGPVFRLAAAAKGDGGLVGGDGEGIASRVDDGDRAFDEEWAVIANFDRNLGHRGFLERPEPRAHGSLSYGGRAMGATGRPSEIRLPKLDLRLGYSRRYSASARIIPGKFGSVIMAAVEPMLAGVGSTLA